MSVFAKRLKEARLRAGMSQERLGLEAGLDPMSASTRMNRYEQGTRMPDVTLIERLGEVLGVPGCYFFAGDDNMASLLVAYGAIPEAKRAAVLRLAEDLAAK